MIFLQEHKDGCLLRVHAQPRASRTALVGLHGDALKIAVQAPPVDSAANEALRDFLAELLGLPRARVSLRAGETSRKKTFQLQGLSLSDAKRALEGKLP
jgi:uncharacterized protein (TIGR00251 family)